ncbi:MAG: hypothetical protein WAL10_07675 [Acetobacteraceae bacterium]|jgi:hypothetical protein
MTVKRLPNRRKQNVRPERFEQMRAPTRDQANVLLRVTRHFNDRRTNVVRKDSDISTRAVWQNAVDKRHIHMRCSQYCLRLCHSSCRAYVVQRFEHRLKNVLSKRFILDNQDMETPRHSCLLLPVLVYK